MAVPASSKCEKCFNPIPSGAVTCPECGAPVGNASTSETEAEVYPELARANLARMRGDYKQAEDQLLSVLKRFPNNPSANEMLGDLAAEREDFAHAVEWYEMALEIVPTSASIARKVKNARASIDKKEAKDTTAQLGLPDPSSRVPVIVGVAIVLIVAVVVGAYFLGAKGAGSQSNLPTPVNKINATQQSSPTNQGPGDQTNAVPAPSAGVAEEQTLLESLKGKAVDAAAIISVSHDPRQNSLIVTFTLNKDDKTLPARIARDAFATFAEYANVTLRGVADGKVAFMADSSRTKMDATQSADYKQQHQADPEAWGADALENVWPAQTPPPTTPPASDTGGTASTGAAPTDPGTSH